ncbi:MAG: hypothetical protein R3F24_12930 [Gammaproteobacteria bacterium]
MSGLRNALPAWLMLPLMGAMLLALGGCSVVRTIDYEQTSLKACRRQVADDVRLDVGIMLFDSGIPPDSTREENEETLIFSEVRQAEARYMPYQLKLTLESSGLANLTMGEPGTIQCRRSHGLGPHQQV